jgi:hypothetical protein
MDSLKLNISYEDAVKLPKGEEKEEWQTVHIIDFYNIVLRVFSIFSDKCTDKSCPTMNAGKEYFLFI